MFGREKYSIEKNKYGRDKNKYGHVSILKTKNVLKQLTNTPKIKYNILM